MEKAIMFLLLFKMDPTLTWWDSWDIYMSDNITLSKAKVALLVSVEMNSGNFLCWPIVLGDTIATPSPIFLDVRLDVEIQEEDEEHGTMKEDDIAVFFGKLTINENGKSCMDEEGGKLD